MSEAGKEAVTRTDRFAGITMPLRSISRVAPQSVQIAKDHALLGKSLWCGVVFSLALLITVINFLPPVPVGYLVSTQVLASPQRVQMLRQHLVNDHSAAARARAHATQLLSVVVLDDDSRSQAGHMQGDKEPLMLLEVVSHWHARTSTAAVHQWLSDLTKTDERTVRQFDAARAQRFARWEVQAHEHYLKHYRHVHGSNQVDEPAASDSAALQLTSAPDRVPTKFASLSAPEIVTSPNQSASADYESQLRQQLEQAELREKNAAADVENQATKLAGVLNLSGSPRVRAAPGRMPYSMVVSMLILALAGGAVGGWANHRAQSGGTFYAADVAMTMQILGLPILGHVQLPVVHLTAADRAIKKRLTDYRRRLVQQSLALSEIVVLFWCMAIGIRMVLDPLWRAMLWENPLAALGRLFVGLP